MPRQASVTHRKRTHGNVSKGRQAADGGVLWLFGRATTKTKTGNSRKSKRRRRKRHRGKEKERGALIRKWPPEVIHRTCEGRGGTGAPRVLHSLIYRGVNGDERRQVEMDVAADTLHRVLCCGGFDFMTSSSHGSVTVFPP